MTGPETRMLAALVSKSPDLGDEWTVVGRSFDHLDTETTRHSKRRQASGEPSTRTATRRNRRG